MCRRSQKFQQFGFGGIASESLINIPCSNFRAQFCFHDDYILRPAQTESIGQQFRQITIQPIEVPHPAHIARGETSHIGILFVQIVCCCNCCPLFGTGANSLADFAIQLHLRQVHADCQIQRGEHGAVVDFFSNVHGFSFPVRGILFPFKAEKNTAGCHAFLCFESYMIWTICSHRRTYRSSMILLSW